MKTKHIIYYLLLIAIFTVPSCKKNDPKPQDNTQNSAPVFSFSGEINGAPVNIQAGVGSYYIIPSYSVDENNVLEFDSEFKSVVSTAGSLKISIKDSRKFSGTTVLMDSALVKGYYAFATPTGAQTQFVQTFVGGLINGKSKTYDWDFGDGTPAMQTTIPTITHKYLHFGVYNVILNVTDSAATCSSSIVNDVKIGALGNLPNAQYITSNNGGNSFTFISSTSEGTAPYTYYWDFGDGNTSSLATPTHVYSSVGVYATSLLITDANGDTDIRHSNLSVQSGSACASFYYTTTILPVADPLNLSSISIEWTDLNGAVWTSKNDKQNTEKSMFKVLSIEDYLANEKGEPTKKITVELSCSLYNGNNSITIKNGKTTFAVSYK